MKTLLIALNNFRIINRFAHPGRFDADIFFTTILRKYLEDTPTPVTSSEVDTAWSEYLINRSSSAAQGKPPMDHKAASTTSHEIVISNLGKTIKATEAKVDSLMKQVEASKKSGSGGSRRGGGGGGGGGRYSTRVPSYQPAKIQRANSHSDDDDKREKLCYKFNSRGMKCLLPFNHNAYLFQPAVKLPKLERVVRRMVTPSGTVVATDSRTAGDVREITAETTVPISESALFPPDTFFSCDGTPETSALFTNLLSLFREIIELFSVVM